MSYAKLLYQLPSARLRDIVRRRARTIRTFPHVHDKRQLCTFLAEALCASTSIGEALAATDRLQLQVLTFAIIQGGSVTFDALIAQMGESSRERLWSAVTDLESLGLVVLTPNALSAERTGRDREIYVPGPVRTHTPLPLPLRRTLPSALENYDPAVIGVIYQTLGLPADEAKTRAARIARITDTLTAYGKAHEIVVGLGEPAISTLEYIVSLGGATTLSQLALRLDSRQRNQLYSYDWAKRWHLGNPRNPVEELLARGLLVFDGAVGWGYGHILVPGNVLAVLTGRPLFAGGAAQTPEWVTLAAAGTPVRRHDSLCRDVAYLMGFLGRTDAVRTSKGNIHRTVLKSLAKGLSVPSPEYAGFVYALARESDLIGPQGRSAFYEVTEQGIAWLDLSLGEQLRTLYEVWRVQTTWLENSEDPLTESTPFYDSDDTRAFRDCGASLLRELHEQQPERLASIRSLAARAEFRWWVRFPSGRGAADEKASTDEGETQTSSQRLLERLFVGSLHWLGLTEVVDAGKSGAFIRLSDRGLAVLGSGDAETMDDSHTVDRFIVQPNLEIFAPPNLSPRLLYRLFRIAEPSSRAGSILSLTSDTLRRALDRGETAESILALFREYSQTGVPQNVEYLINEVGGKHGHIHIGQAGLYIQVADPVLLKEIKAQKKLNIHFRRQLTDTVALVTGDSVDSILKHLRQAGYLPVSDEDQRDVVPALSHMTRTYKSPVRPAKNSAEPRVDWEGVAADDGTPWDQPESHEGIERPATAAKMRELMARAARSGLVLVIRYQPDARAGSTERKIEPIGLAGSLLRAFDRTKGAAVLFNVRYITSVWTTGETFDKPGEGSGEG